LGGLGYSYRYSGFYGVANEKASPPRKSLVFKMKASRSHDITISRKACGNIKASRLGLSTSTLHTCLACIGFNRARASSAPDPDYLVANYNTVCNPDHRYTHNHSVLSFQSDSSYVVWPESASLLHSENSGERENLLSYLITTETCLEF